MSTKYPNIPVNLVGHDGNAFMVLARVCAELRRAGISKDEIQQFRDEATAGDYAHLIGTVADWVTVV